MTLKDPSKTSKFTKTGFKNYLENVTCTSSNQLLHPEKNQIPLNRKIMILNLWLGKIF